MNVGDECRSDALSKQKKVDNPQAKENGSHTNNADKNSKPPCLTTAWIMGPGGSAAK